VPSSAFGQVPITRWKPKCKIGWDRAFPFSRIIRVATHLSGSRKTPSAEDFVDVFVDVFVELDVWARDLL
jgi:hypothetical protein